MDLADHRHTPDEGGVLYEALIRYAEVEITAAEILDLYTTPKELVAAPGAGKIIELISLELALDYVSAAYSTADVGNIAVRYTDAGGAAVSVDLASVGFIDEEADQLRLLMKLATNVTPVVNAALVLAVDGSADPTAGDSPIHAKVAYRVHETGL